MHDIPIIILAAGSSSRLGQPKQLLLIDGETLLNRTIRTAKQISNAIIVVLGANIELISPTISDQSITIVTNPDWETGMSTSIKVGLSQCLKFENAIICLCDQPFLTENILNALINKKSTSEKQIIASYYSQQIGVPILFNKIFFNDLLNLKGDKGAKSILNKYADQIDTIQFHQGATDIDTLVDLKNFMKNQEKLQSNV